jgi:hypothetical protein
MPIIKLYKSRGSTGVRGRAQVLGERTKAYNLNWTTPDTPGAKVSWMGVFRESTASAPKACSIAGCETYKGKLHGAHVVLRGQEGVWIVPLCPTHNTGKNSWRPFWLERGTTVVAIDMSDELDQAIEKMAESVQAQMEALTILGRGVDRPRRLSLPKGERITDPDLALL